jgi:hypothetical protein
MLRTGYLLVGRMKSQYEMSCEILGNERLPINIRTEERENEAIHVTKHRSSHVLQQIKYSEWMDADK